MNFFGSLNKRFFISRRKFKGDTQIKVTVRQKLKIRILKISDRLQCVFLFTFFFSNARNNLLLSQPLQKPLKRFLVDPHNS